MPTNPNANPLNGSKIPILSKVRTILGAAVVALVCFSLIPFSQAATVSWSTTAGSGLWSASSNWSPNAPALSSDALIFALSTTTNLTQDVPGQSVAGLTVNSNAPAYTLALGQPLTLQAGSNLTVNSGTGGNFTLVGPSALQIGTGSAGAGMNANATSASILVNAPVISSSSSGAQLNLSGTGAGFINGVISDGPGVLSLAKSGTGTWTLRQANS